MSLSLNAAPLSTGITVDPAALLEPGTFTALTLLLKNALLDPHIETLIELPKAPGYLATQLPAVDA